MSSPAQHAASGSPLPDCLTRFKAGKYRPASFLDRGVTLPFTTLCLLGGRIRPGERRSVELVLANPAGTEGFYILPWSAIPDLCAPTLHDRALWSRVAEITPLTPRSMREAAREVAGAGHAGRAASRAAATATAARHQARTLLHYHLLLELVRQVEPSGTGLPPPEKDHPGNIKRRAVAALSRLRSDDGITPSAAVEVLSELADVFEGCGLRRDAARARLPLLAAEMTSVTQDAAAWSATVPEEVWGDGREGAQAEAQGEARGCAALLVQAADLTLRCSSTAFTNAHALLDDLWGLLRRWRAAPEEIMAQLARPEWLLDEWGVICALWRGADPACRHSALVDMAALVPVLPAEVGAWVGFDAAGEMEGHRDGLRRRRRTVPLNHDRAPSRQQDLTARNEALRVSCP